MAGKGEGEGQGSWHSKITGLRYTLFCFNVVMWIVGASMFGLCLWLRLDPGFQDWVQQLSLQQFYSGLYVLIVVACLIMIVAFVGCGAALMEHRTALWIFSGLQALSFVMGLAGAATLLDYSTPESSLQPLVRNVTRLLISNSQYEPSAGVLRMVQENIGCCGADGPNDFLVLKKPLPSECRDSVTGNAHFHGCVDELTWFLEDKASWLSGLTMLLCLINVINVVLSALLVEAVQKEEAQALGYETPGYATN